MCKAVYDPQVINDVSGFICFMCGPKSTVVAVKDCILLPADGQNVL